MRIVVSLLNYRPGRIGGAETYLKQLLTHLPNLVAAKDEIVLLGHRGNAAQLASFRGRQVIVDRGDLALVAARCLEAFTPWRAGAVERLLAGLAPDVVLFPQQSMFPKRAGWPSVLVAFDVQHLFYPRRFSLFDRCFRAGIYPLSMRRADKIVAISHWSRRTLIQRCGVAAGKVVAVPLGFTPRPATPCGTGQAAPHAGLPHDVGRAPYLYYPAATYPHKGHATLLRTYSELRGRGDFPYQLLLSGQRTAYWKRLERQIHRLGLEADVTHLGFLSREEVDRTYQGAAAVLFPTEFEGFGIPVLEAVQHGKKIVCSRLEVFDELGVPPEAQIDFHDARQLRAALHAAGPTVLLKTPITWEESTRRLLTELRRVARGPALG